MGLVQKYFEIPERAVDRIDRVVVGDVVTIIFERRGVEGQQPKCSVSEILEVIEPLREPLKVADAIRIAVLKGPDVQFVDDSVFIPERVALNPQVGGFGFDHCVCTIVERTLMDSMGWT